MRSRTILACLTLATSLALPLDAIAQPPVDTPDRALDDAARTAVIDGLLKKIDTVYVFPDVAKKMEHAIRDRQATKEYDAVTNGREFAEVLTRHLRDVCKDGHLSVDFHAKGVAYD